jgi:hypothetical protein
VFIFHSLIEAKGKHFKALLKKEGEGTNILPKMDRFWGNEGEDDYFKDSWEVYEHFDYE